MITGRNPYADFVRKPAGERFFGIPRRRLENNIKIGLMKYVVRMCTRFIWLISGTSNGLF
jgi:hypothetical protein